MARENGTRSRGGGREPGRTGTTVNRPALQDLLGDLDNLNAIEFEHFVPASEAPALAA